MTATRDDTTHTLRKLIRSCKEAQEGFRTAAEQSQNPDLKRLFNIYAHQRSRFEAELREHVLCDGEGIEETGGEFQKQNRESHPNEESAILNECLATDSRALDLYRHALSGRIPSKAHFLIAAQYSLMQRVHARLAGMTRPAIVPGVRIAGQVVA